MSKRKTPIALFTYNRPDHTQRVLETLSRCARLDECRLHIFCDGAKRDEHRAGVEATRVVAREWGARLDAEILERVENRGLARSIVGGVSQLCDEYGRVIVLEDDFALSPSFIHYMLEALERYNDEAQVYQISGYMFPVEHGPQPDAFFLPLTTTWGWATWQRAWQVFDWEASGAKETLADVQARRRFNLDGSYPYEEMLWQRLSGQNDSWGILWWWAVFKAGGLVLHPRRSLVWNGGFDGSGVHCDEAAEIIQPSLESVTEFLFTSPLNLPSHVIADKQAFERVTSFLRNQNRKPSLRDRLRRRIARYVSS